MLTYLTDEDIVNYICEEIKPPQVEEAPDKTWWMGNSTSNFSVKSA